MRNPEPSGFFSASTSVASSTTPVRNTHHPANKNGCTNPHHKNPNMPTSRHQHKQSPSAATTSGVIRMRERVVDHPLKSRCGSPVVVPENILTVEAAETGSTSVTSTHCSSLTTTINTASLIQSAARSVLDNTPASTNVSDDEYEYDEESQSGDYYSYNTYDDDDSRSSCADGSSSRRRRSRQQRVASPTLRSLQRETLPAMPDEQDRKRFVGCLAAILASSYDYDVADEEDETAESRAESYAYLNRSEQEHDMHDMDERPSFVSMAGATATMAQDKNVCAAAATTTTTIDEDENDYPFDEDPSVLYPSCSASFEFSEISGGNQPTSQSAANPTSASSTSPSRPMHYPSPSQIQQTQQRHRKSPIKPSQRDVKKKILARQRHRKRRYNVLSKLLLSSAELLLLEKSQARAFLPMLARVLVPQSVAQKTAQKQRLQRQRGQRQRKPPLHNHHHLNHSKPGATAAAGGGSTTSTPTKSTTTTSAARRSPKMSAPSELPASSKGVNHYHYSPTSTMPISRSKPLPGYDYDHGYGTAANDHDKLFEYQEEEFLLPSELDEEDHLRPFLESLSPGAGFRCLSLLLLQHLLHSTNGYDARIRHVIKKLGVIVLIRDMEQERELERHDWEERGTSEQQQQSNKKKSFKHKKRSRHKKRNKTQQATSAYDDLVGPATRKFEALEHCIAARLIRLSKEQQKVQRQQQQQQQQHRASSNSSASRAARHSQVHPKPATSQDRVAPTAALSREQFVRGLKIGSAGLVAGSLFAVTGGLAAPGIAAGLAAIAGSTAATAAVVSIVSSTPAVVSIFGVGGGSLAAYKMQRRIQGLTEFEFRREEQQEEQQKRPDREGQFHLHSNDDDEDKGELFSTICVSGWLRDECDFQRPWGIAPSYPPLQDRLELLERFYSVYRPDHVPKCKRILARWKGEEKQLWTLLRQKYGRDPDHLFPLQETTCNGFHRGLTLDQEEVLNRIFVELGYVGINDSKSDVSGTTTSDVSAKKPGTAFQSIRERLRNPYAAFTNTSSEYHVADFNQNGAVDLTRAGSHLSTRSEAMMMDSLHGPAMDGLSFASSGFDSLGSSSFATANTHFAEEQGEEKEPYLPPKHLATVWDYHATYGGEVYTVRWESDMLVELCDSVTDLAFDVLNGATAQILRQTALSTLMSAVAIPYALINAANMIDGTWTLAVERADEAGKELARSLLFSRAGHRPITLVGYSFGARAIYSCLKELARYQEKWENSREKHQRKTPSAPDSSSEYSWKLREPASIVEDVIIMGLPNHLSLTSWRACRQIVGGRLVNCYSRKDLILSLMFQFKRLAGALKPVCGTCPVNIPGVENVDVSDLVLGHQDYCTVTGQILKRVRHGQPFRSSLKVVSEGASDPDNVESSKRRIDF